MKVYIGTAKDGSELNISLVKSDASIKVKRLGYKFAGSLRVVDVLMETGEPFGIMKNGEIQFEFPVFISFMPTGSLNNPSGDLGMAAYKAMLRTNKGKVICILERINTLSAEYKSLTMQNIEMEGKM